MFETILVILLLVILIYLVQFRKDVSHDMNELKIKLSQLERDTIIPTPPRQEETFRPQAQPSPPPPFSQKMPETPPVPEQPVRSMPVPETPEQPLRGIPVPEVPEPVIQKVDPFPKATTFAPREPVVQEEKPGFWERNPDLEKFIGENLFNKIGIGILVIGIGFFLKFAIDKNWINEIGRTFIGFLCGALLIGLAHYLRRSFAAFSSVLVGGGVAVLYFTVTIAFQQYHLIPQWVAFGLTILITAFTVLLSLHYNRVELAIVAILGGFSSPFLVSTGEANAIVFFTYLLILNIGMLVLAYFKKWNIVNIICYLATILLYGGWLVLNVPGGGQYGVMLLFGTLFYIVFFLMNVVNNVRNNIRFGPIEIGILLSNTFLYFAAGLFILHHWGGGTFQGLFTVLLAVFNCIFAYSLYRNQQADRTLIFLLIGLVLTFMSLAAPIQLEGNYITLFWAAETVLLYWLWQKSGIVQMRYATFAVMGLMLISLIMDWPQIYFSNNTQLLPFANKGFITGAVVTAALWGTRLLVKKEPEDRYVLPGVPASLLVQALGLAVIITVYVIVSLDLFYQFSHHATLLRTPVIAAFNYLYLAVLWYLARNSRATIKQSLLLLTLAGALALPIALNGCFIAIREARLAGEAPLFYFLFHYVVIALLAWAAISAYKNVQKMHPAYLKAGYQWSAAVIALIILSAELDHVLVLITGNPAVLKTSHGAGYALLWGVYAFVLMFMGLRLKSKELRIIAISVFAITILKLFLFDLSGLGEGGKIAAFISLGILLLLISFMYQRLKKIILTDEEDKA